MFRGSVKVWRVAILLTLALSWPLSMNGWAQQYPHKPITMIVGWGAGGSTDVT